MPENVEQLLPVFDDWPSDLMSPARGETLIAERVEEIKRVCRLIADRARRGDLRDMFEMFEETPDEALQGLVDEGWRIRQAEEGH